MSEENRHAKKVAGLDFFRRSLELQKKHQKAGTLIENTFQINGFLLNDDWCRFFHDNSFLVGLSMDGPRSFMIITGRTEEDMEPSTGS